MLQITVPASEYYDERTNTFHKIEEQTLSLEHSLVSLSKWEAKWHKPYMTKKEKSIEETIDYIRCMTVTPHVDPDIYTRLTNENLDQILKYIQNPMTATTINNTDPRKGSNKIVTSELIYYWMVAFNIPFECQKWHLNRLLTLIEICNIENQPAKKMGKGDILRNNAALNAARRKKLNTRG